MENPSKLFAGATRMAVPPDAHPQLAAEWRLARSIYRELQLMAMPPANLLLIGTGRVMQHILKLLLPVLDEPISTWRPGDLLILPSAAHAGTIILDGVSALTPDDQHRLLAWSDHAPRRTRVVSTAAASVFPLVEAGAFNDTLYYRLNVVCVDVAEHDRNERSADGRPDEQQDA
jgi:hypothetical protein